MLPAVAVITKTLEQKFLIYLFIKRERERDGDIYLSYNDTAVKHTKLIKTCRHAKRSNNKTAAERLKNSFSFGRQASSVDFTISSTKDTVFVKILQAKVI